MLLKYCPASNNWRDYILLTDLLTILIMSDTDPAPQYSITICTRKGVRWGAWEGGREGGRVIQQLHVHKLRCVLLTHKSVFLK